MWMQETWGFDGKEMGVGLERDVEENGDKIAKF